MIMRVAFLTSAALLMTACAGGPGWQAPPARESLVPEITQDGTKFFVFRRDYLSAQEQIALPQQRGRSQQRLPIGEFEVPARVQAVLDLTGYCREGFFERSREQTSNYFSLRGECREGANSEDRVRFTEALDLSALPRP